MDMFYPMSQEWLKYQFCVHFHNIYMTIKKFKEKYKYTIKRLCKTIKA